MSKALFLDREHQNVTRPQTIRNFKKYVDQLTNLSCEWLFCNCQVTFGHSSTGFLPGLLTYFNW